MRLSTDRHDRDGAGLVHVYPVLSRRSGGVSVGVNLNPDKACNFRCVYCQVEGLVRGKPEPVDERLLEEELRGFLEGLLRGDTRLEGLPPGAHRPKDVAFSGDGEPTSSPNFERAVSLVARVMDEFELRPHTRLVLITNGSLVGREEVARGIAKLGEPNGEVWFKLDSATDAGLARINDFAGGIERAYARLAACARLSRTFVQTCVFATDGRPPGEDERAAYLELLRRAVRENLGLAGVQLYGLARRVRQPDARRVGRLDANWLEALAVEIEGVGLPVVTKP
ncbi:MAG: radical SAM protein [Planctomycetes bacterium]|jgi:wyosine [tRNA(Phe)-imidazoG37] synthetase (radical SAM superfamily)|nr:radical SAM protein [Planctomycetota bacterium]MDP6409049.1 radical SAM protein [Planctomycetota bacterium]